MNMEGLQAPKYNLRNLSTGADADKERFIHEINFRLLQAATLAAKSQAMYNNGKFASTVEISILAFEWANKAKGDLVSKGDDLKKSTIYWKTYYRADQVLAFALDHLGRPVRELQDKKSVALHLMQVEIISFCLAFN